VASVARFDTWQAADGTNVARFSGGELQVWDGAAWVATGAVEIDFLVIGGGGGGGVNSGTRGAGGGGAGGYRCSVSGEDSGGGESAETQLVIPAGVDLPIYIGAGGAGGPSNNSNGSSGQNTIFGPIVSIGGGMGAGGAQLPTENGGSGGGQGNLGVAYPGPFGVPGQGFKAGDAQGTSFRSGSGGGGAGGVGTTSTGTGVTAGGVGVASSITGSSVTRAVGGSGSGTGSEGGSAGGANTGTGGDAGLTSGDNGGSGVVIFRVDSGVGVSFSAGVTQSSATVGSNDVYTVTATSTTSETVTIG